MITEEQRARYNLSNRLYMRKYYKERPLAFISYKSMKQRCLNPNQTVYRHYGGRGITICERWLLSFENFFADMGERPSRKYSLDRIDPDGNYEPSNCRWATQKEQVANQRVKPEKTHCVQGHELIGENLKFYKNGQKRCGECARITAAQCRAENPENHRAAVRKYRAKLKKILNVKD